MIRLTAWVQVRRFFRFGCATLFDWEHTKGDVFTDGTDQSWSRSLYSCASIEAARICFRFLGIEACALFSAAFELLEAVKTFMISFFLVAIGLEKRVKTDRKKRNLGIWLLLLSMKANASFELVSWWNQSVHQFVNERNDFSKRLHDKRRER